MSRSRRFGIPFTPGPWNTSNPNGSTAAPLTPPVESIHQKGEVLIAGMPDATAPVPLTEKVIGLADAS